jgi:hypothetical protein
MAAMVTLKLDELEGWLEQETTDLVEPLRADAKKQLEDVRSKLEELLESSDKLSGDAEKELAKGSRKTYRRAKALHKLAGTFADLIEEVTIPKEITGKSLSQASEQIEKTLKTIGKERAKWFRAISPYFIISRRRFDVMLKRADDSFQNFKEFMSEEYVRAESAENVPSTVEELRASICELNELEKVKEKRKHRKEVVEKKITQSQQKLQMIQTKDEVVELAQMNQKIKELTASVKHNLRHLQKPLLKFQTLVNSPGYNLLAEENAKLDEYLTKPFKALATEKEGYPLLRVIVQKIDSALDNKKLKLKPSRMRKAKDQIADILNKNSLLELQKSCSEVFSKKYELSTSGVISESKDEKAELQNCLKDLEIKMRLLEARDARFEKQHKEACRKVDDQKTSLEKIVSELASKNVQIVID